LKNKKKQTRTQRVNGLLLWATFHRSRLEHGHAGIKLEKKWTATSSKDSKQGQLGQGRAGASQAVWPQTGFVIWNQSLSHTLLINYNLNAVTFKVVRNTSKIPRACEVKY